VKILAKLLLAYVAPALLLFAVFGWLAYDLLARDLDAELGTRLAAIAAQTATRLRGEFLVEMDPADPAPSAWSFTRKELIAALAATGVERMYVFTPAHTSLADTRDGVAIGQRYNELELDRHELGRVLAGTPAATVLYRGRDGRFYKAGYAPVTRSDKDPTVVAALRVEAPATYFGDLDALRARLVTSGAALAAVVVLVSFVVATLLTRPLRRLAAAATRIGQGELAAPVPVAGADEIGVLARTLDEMRAALRARDERLQMMLAGIAHEVRNPLGGIELFAGILRDEVAPEQRAHVARIETELQHLKSVVSDFLEYARRPKPEPARVDLAGLAAEVREVMAADAEAAGVALRVEGPAVVVAADATQLRRALLNLVRNALQATPRGGTVALATARGARLTVSDTGAGIPAERLARIFDPFYTTKEQGTGLGLAFVREIVTDHGGMLEVDSAPGAGTRFTIALPEDTTWASS
jgi:signal transduction histidine kinase